MFTEEQKQQYRPLIAKAKVLPLTEGVKNLTVEKYLDALEKKVETTKQGSELLQKLQENPFSAICAFVNEQDRHPPKKKKIGKNSASYAEDVKRKEVNSKITRGDW